MADQQTNERDTAGSGDRSDAESEVSAQRRIVTDGSGEAVVGERSEIDPNELEGHQKNQEIYGDEPELGGLVTDMENEGYDRGNPLTINSDQTVIKGHRRWKAALEVGIDSVPVIEREFTSRDDEEAALLLDNLLQRSQTFSQKMREATELERINDEADDDSGARTEIVNEFLDTGEGRTRDQIAAAVDLGSGETYRRAKRVWEAAEGGDEEAEEQVALIDTGEQSIHGAFTHLQDDTGADDDDDEQGNVVEAPEDGTGTRHDTESGSSDSAGADGDGTTPPSTENAGTGAEREEETDAADPDVADENPPPSAELDDRDDPTEEMGMGRSEGGGVGEDASQSPAEMADNNSGEDSRDTSEVSDDGEFGPSSMTDEDEDGNEDDTGADTHTVDEDERVVSADDFVIEGELAEEIREQAAETDHSADEVLDKLISNGNIESGESEDESEAEDEEDESESDDASEEDGMLVALDGNEDKLQSKARELNLEPDEVVNKLVDAWLDGDETPFEMAQ